MRLVCPNCEAKYEVPEDAIPDSGRDVQCANCGHAWFQMPSRVGATAVEAVSASAEGPLAEPVGDLVAKAVPEPEAPGAIRPDDAPAATRPVEADAVTGSAMAETASGRADMQASESVSEPLTKAEPEIEPETAPVVAATPAYAVDASVLAILREEAEREAEARRAEARPLETQPDLGLDAAMPARQRPALVASDGALLGGVEDAASKPSARRDLLPDVEEINSTLRPSEVSQVADDGQASVAQRDGRGFRSGFLVVMTLAIIGAAIYLLSPQLSAMVPALAGPLDAYVGAVDSLRLSLDGMMRSATVAINGE